MAELGNPRWEKFAVLTAQKKQRADAYWGAGFKASNRKSATRKGSRLLTSHTDIQARVVEIENDLNAQSLASTNLTQEEVIRGLRDNIEMATQAKPVLDRDGNETGEYKVELTAANRAWELLGKHQGMFRERLDVFNMDGELEGKTDVEMRQYLKALAADVGVRVVDQSDDECRAWIYRNASRLGLIVAEAGSPDPAGAEDPQDHTLRAVS
jgi:hypothetical protein